MRLLSKEALRLVNLFILEVLGHVPLSRWEKEQYYITCPARFSCYDHAIETMVAEEVSVLFNYVRTHSTKPENRCRCDYFADTGGYDDYSWPHNSPFVCIPAHNTEHVPYLACFSCWDDLPASDLQYHDVLCVLHAFIHRISLRRVAEFKDYVLGGPLWYFRKERTRLSTAIRSLINEKDRDGLSIELVSELFRRIVAYLFLVHANTWVLCTLTKEETKELETCTDKFRLSIGAKEIVRRERTLWILSHSRDDLWYESDASYMCFTEDYHADRTEGSTHEDSSLPPHTMLSVAPAKSYIVLFDVYQSLELASEELCELLAPENLCNILRTVHREDVKPNYQVYDAFVDRPFLELGLDTIE